MKVRRLDPPSLEQREQIRGLMAAWLSGAALPSDEDFEQPQNATWGVLDEAGELVGFATASACEDGSVMLSSAVVCQRARGLGLQRRLIRARVRWARKLGATRVWTYTSFDNVVSAANLNACGLHYRGMSPDGVWVYWGQKLVGR